MEAGPEPEPGSEQEVREVGEGTRLSVPETMRDMRPDKFLGDVAIYHYPDMIMD